MEKRQRMALLGVAALIAVVAVVIAVASGGDDEEKPSSTTTRATDAQSGGQAGPPASTAATETTPPEPETTEIRVANGEPVGGVQDVEARKGDTVRIAITGDKAEPAHLHGYDIEKPLEPGKATLFRFNADIEGVFEIELEDSGTKIAELTVEP